MLVSLRGGVLTPATLELLHNPSLNYGRETATPAVSLFEELKPHSLTTAEMRIPLLHNSSQKLKVAMLGNARTTVM